MGGLSRGAPDAVIRSPVAAVARQLTGDRQERLQLRQLPSIGAIVREALLVDRLFPKSPGFRRDRFLDRDRDAAFLPLTCSNRSPAAVSAGAQGSEIDIRCIVRRSAWVQARNCGVPN